MKIKTQGIFHLLLLAVVFSIYSTAQAQTVMQKLKKHENTSHFAQALENTNIDERLNQAGPFTLFAPSNRFFDELSTGQKSDSNLLLNHVFMGMATQRSLKAMSDITCLSGRTITINESDENLSVNSIVVISSNIKADNGIIHVIDGVIQ